MTDQVGDNAYGSSAQSIQDLDNQTDTSNYVYDEIGNIVQDKAESITNIKWSVYGKIMEINRTATAKNNVTKITYNYDAQSLPRHSGGNRIGKVVYGKKGIRDYTWYTWYARDAQGNLMSTYTTVDSNAVLPNKFDTLFLVQADRHIYGSSRLGVNPSDNSMDGGPVSSQYYEYGQFSRGWRQYELTNHLGNVLTTVSDRKIGVYSNGSLTLPNDSVLAVVDYYEPFMVSATDYYPFGMVSRQISAGAAGLTDYRYGFNGKENDNEVKGFGNQQDYGMRIYDARLGRFLSVDPLSQTYPWFTPYQFAGNGPIVNLDLDGLEDYNVNVALDDKGHYMSNSGPEFRAGYFQQWLSDAFGVNVPKTYYVVALRGSTDVKVDKNGGSNIIGAWKVGSYGNVQKFISDEGYRNQVMGTPDVVQKQQLESEQWLEEYNANLRAGLGAKFVLDRKQTKQQTPANATTPIASTNNQATASNSNPATKSKAQQITAKREDPQIGVNWEGKEFRMTAFDLVNGKLQIRGQGMKGAFDFIVTKEGKLKIGIGHYHLSGSAPTVQAAGTIKIWDGKIIRVSNKSGHYKPTEQETNNFLDILKNAGVDVSGAKLNYTNQQ